MSLVKRLGLIMLVVLVAACGGGGGDKSSTNISVTPEQLQFDVMEDATQTKSIAISFKGAAVIVGYPSKMAEPDWLEVEQMPGTSSTVTLKLRVDTYGLDLGTYTTVLRVATGLEDGSNIVYKDVAVKLNVAAGRSEDISGLSMPTAPLYFSKVEAGAAALGQTLNITSKVKPANWRILVSYETGSGDWLSVSQTSGAITAVDTQVAVNVGPLPQGSYKAKLLLLDSEGITRSATPISYEVTAGFAIARELSKVLNADARKSDLFLSLDLQSFYDSTTGSKLSWAISSDQPWLKVLSSAGNLSQSQNLKFELSAAELLQLGTGVHTANLTLTFASAEIAPITIPVTIDLRFYANLVVESDISFELNNSSTDADLVKTLALKTNLGEAFNTVVKWHLRTEASWLKVLTPEGDTGDKATVQLKVDKKALADLPNGYNGTTLYFTVDHPGFISEAKAAWINLHFASIDSVAPYVAYTGRSEAIVIHGRHFLNQNSLKVNFAGVLVDATALSDTEIRINYPKMMEEKRFDLSIDNALQVPLAGANFVVKNPPLYSALKIPVNERYSAITLDAERNAILLAGYLSNDIGRIHLHNDTWDSDSMILGRSTIAALGGDGKEILVMVGSGTNSGNVNVLSLNADSLVVKRTIPSYEAFRLDSDYSNLGDLMRNGIISLSFSSSEFILSRDHSRLLSGSTNNSNARSFDTSNSIWVDRILGLQYARANLLSMSSDGGRLVAENAVYDRNFTFLGRLRSASDTPDINSEYINPSYVAVTPNGKSVYVSLWDENSQTFFARYDISAEKGPYFAQNEPLPFALGANERPIQMLVSDDGGALFVLTDNYNSSNEALDSRTFYVFPLTDAQ